MTRQRFDRLTIVAGAAGVRLFPVGNGGIEALHRGQRIPLANLDTAALWLMTVSPQSQAAIVLAAKSNAQFQRLQRGAAKGVRREARHA